MRKTVAFYLSVAALAVLSAFAFVKLRSVRANGSPALAESAFTAFGGIRSLLAEVVWFRADRLQEEGQYAELAQLARALTLAEPHTPEVWSYAAWNLAYNVSVMMPTFEDRWIWVESAISLLRDEGLRYNPTSVQLHQELAWLFELKLAANIDSAADVYRRLWREKVRDVEKRGAWEELAFEPMRMTDLENRFGLTDRADPCYSSAYWAWRGIPYARDANECHILKQILHQSLVIYGRNHRSPGTGKNG